MRHCIIIQYLVWLNRVSTFDVIRLDKLENERQNLPKKEHIKYIGLSVGIQCTAHPHVLLNYIIKAVMKTLNTKLYVFSVDMIK